VHSSQTQPLLQLAPVLASQNTHAAAVATNQRMPAEDPRAEYGGLKLTEPGFPSV